MSCSTIQVVMILFIQTIFLLFSTPTTIATTTPSSLIKEACSFRNDDAKSLCLQIFQSDKRIVSAKTLYDLSIAIMESGISNATKTWGYIKKQLKKRNLEPNALKECNHSYFAATMSFRSALGEVQEHKDYVTATYDLKIASTDAMHPCQKAVASKRITDEIILTGNKVLPIFGFSAYDVVTTLLRQAPPAK